MKQIQLNHKKGSTILKENLGLVLDIIRAYKLIETDFDLDITNTGSFDVFLEILASLDKRKFNHLVTILKEQEQTGLYLAEYIKQEVTKMRGKKFIFLSQNSINRIKLGGNKINIILVKAVHYYFHYTFLVILFLIL